MPAHTSSLSSRRALSRGLAATSATLFAATTTAALLSPPAVAATNANWGSDGITTSDSAVTARWDNRGNAAVDTVSRAAGTVLLHTGGKTYADLDADKVAWYQKNAADLSVTVSQTKNLANQTVQLSIAGFTGGTGGASGAVLEVYQCWGAWGADGRPDPAAAAPDPETCQSSGARSGELIDPNVDGKLVADGDWGPLVANGNYEIPFRAVDGTVPSSTFTDPDTGAKTSYATRATDNPYFSAQTTNQLTVYPPSDGTAARPFEVQTTTEAQGLGCGLNADTPSTSRCWIVVVPKPSATYSGLAPTAWANRVQVAVDFADVGAACPTGQQRTLLAGSELLSQAMGSWIPALCAQRSTALGYTVLGDAQVRRELDAGTRKSGVLSVPGTADSFTSPVAVAGVVIAYRIDTTDGATPAGQIKLNPRLLAKLLTQSYNGGLDAVMYSQISTKAPWAADEVSDLGADPEFTALNPDANTNGGGAGGDVIASLTQSDAAAAVWDWILADKQAAAFLHGCPDDYGKVINPFFSTRTYQECPDQAQALDAVTKTRIAATQSPDNYVYVTPTYPSDAAAFPQPNWYARDAVYKTDADGKQVLDRTPLTLSDIHPRQNALADVGRTVGRAIYPSNTTFCYTFDDDSCLPVPGKWKSTSTPGLYGQRYAMGITDSVTAARFGLQTATLCATSDTTGKNCVGADKQSLQAAANAFVGTGSVLGNSLTTGGTADYGSGAYPLTLPVYASVAKKALTQTDAHLYADLFEWIGKNGQSPGLDTGQLPPGYAPLTPNLLAVSDTAVSQLRAWVPPTTPTPTTTPQATTPATTTPATQAATVPSSAARPQELAVAAAQEAPAVASPAAVASPQVVAQVGTTGPTETGFPPLALAGGLGGALAAGIASPIVGGPRRRKL